MSSTEHFSTRNEPWFEAKTMQRQLISLSYLLSNADWNNEFQENSFYKDRLIKSKTADNNVIRKLMINSWNTEYLLYLNQEVANQSGRAFVLHWAFPQAYYSVFSNLLAHYNSLGYPHSSHQSALRHYAQLVVDKKIPKSASIYCDGGYNNMKFYGIQPSLTAKHFYLDIGSLESRHHQICQFLKSTRQIKLSKKKNDLKFFTKEGKEKKQLSVQDWNKISDRIGPTTILDLLYRKRIKSNYGEIDSYISEDFEDGARILQHLREVVRWMNFINEAYTAKAIGWSNFSKIISIYKNGISSNGIYNRMEYLEYIVNGV